MDLWTTLKLFHQSCICCSRTSNYVVLQLCTLFLIFVLVIPRIKDDQAISESSLVHMGFAQRNPRSCANLGVASPASSWWTTAWSGRDPHAQCRSGSTGAHLRGRKENPLGNVDYACVRAGNLMVSKMVLLVAHGNPWGFRGCHWEGWRCSLSVHAFERKIAGNQSFPFGSNSVRCGTLACKTPDPCFFFCGNSIFEAFGFGTAPKIYPPCGLFKSDLFCWVFMGMTVFMSIGQRKHYDSISWTSSKSDLSFQLRHEDQHQ